MKLTDICRCMMEEGYYPKFEKTQVIFNIGDDMAVLEYKHEVISMRVLFSIDEEYYNLFLEISNSITMSSPTVKAGITDNGRNLMFCCETLCDNRKSFRKHLPVMVASLSRTIEMHREEMRKQILAFSVFSTATRYVQ